MGEGAGDLVADDLHMRYIARSDLCQERAVSEIDLRLSLWQEQVNIPHHQAGKNQQPQPRDPGALRFLIFWFF